MKKLVLFFVLFLSSCAIFEQKKEISEVQVKKEMYGNLRSIVELQNPNTKDVVYCMKDEYRTAEECAEIFTKLGFVRTRNIPYKTAKYDILQTDTYPTRRWREGELTPRW